MGEPVKIYDLAKDMIRLNGLTPITEEASSLPEGTHATSGIEIVTTGLRPGEKLFEELLIGNNPSKTFHTSDLYGRGADDGSWDELNRNLRH